MKAHTHIVCLAVVLFAMNRAWPDAVDEAKPRACIDVGGEKHLFLDALFFEHSERITLQMHPARKTDETVLAPDKPWENASLNWFSVLEDDGKFRMWYECYDVEGWPTTDDTSFCYAESADGIHWSKPNLGLYAYHGSTDNNILFRQIGPAGVRSRVHGAGVFLDPVAPAEARYKGVSQGIFEGLGVPPHRVAGMSSPDGLHWTRFPAPLCGLFADSQYSAFWDADQNAYVLYGRVGGKGRAIGRAQSADFVQFDPLALVLEKESDRDLYNPAAMKYVQAARAYFMFPSVYKHQTDTLDIHLAVSRDGIHWTWPGGETPFIRLGDPGRFDSGSLYMGQGIVRQGEELWQYFSGAPLKHEEATLERLTQPENRRLYSRVVSRLDGFVSADAGADEGRFITPPLRFTGNTLTLNADVREGGRLRVGLVDEAGNALPGFRIEDAVPITGNHTRAIVRWTTPGDLARHAADPVRMAVSMSNASLYAFQFESLPPAES